MKSINRSMSLTEWLLLMFLSLLWGGSFFFIEVAVAALPPFTLVAARLVLGAVILNFVLRAVGLPLPNNKKVWAALAVMGILNNIIPFTLIVWGQTHIASGLASILNATTPFFGIIVAHFLTKDEKLTRARFIGVIIGFAGVVTIIGTDILANLGTNTLAQLAILGAALSYAFAGVFGRRFQKLDITPMGTATGQITASAVMMVPIALLFETPWTVPIPEWTVWGAVLGLAIFSTALAYILYFRILATAGATNLLLVTFLIPVSAILLGTFVLGEQLLPKHFIGMGFLGVGLMIIDGRFPRYISRNMTGRST